MQHQMFAAQVINDRSESEQPDEDKHIEELEEVKDTDLELEDSTQQGEHTELDKHSDDPEGSQYEEGDTSYEEYDGYAMPSEDNDSEVKYICASYEIKTSTSMYPLPHNDAHWELRCNEIHSCYEIAPWIPHDALEFTPQYSVTHMRGCNACINFKEHIIRANAFEGQDSFAWRACNKYEQDLMLLG
jgi:hypothetical protein